MNDWVIAGPIIVLCWGTIALLFWRLPDFRRTFLHYWHPKRVAQRMHLWAAGTRLMRPKSREDVLEAIREHHRALGVPVDDLTDEELIANIQRLTTAMREAGISAQDANRRMKAFAAALDAVEGPRWTS